MSALRQVTYSPAIFNAGNMQDAKRIILTPEDGTTEQRWEKETPYLLSLLEANIPLNENSRVIDYGCGIGRMSKALIDRFGCQVLGVDISPSMRGLAPEYVNSDLFRVVSPEALGEFEKADLALAVWVLQHCYDPQSDINKIRKALKPNGKIFIVNDRRRIVPTRETLWVDDGKNIAEMLDLNPLPLNPSIVGQRISDASYWAVKSWA